MLSVIVMLIVVGVLLYIVGLIPMEPTVKKIIYAVAILAVVLWLLEGFGLLKGLPRFNA